MQFSRVFILLLVLPGVLTAQSADSVVADKPHFQVIKITPLQLLSFYPCVLLGYEHGITANQSLQAEAGPAFYYNSYDQEFQRKRGVKLRSTYRYYFEKNNVSTDGHYLAVEAYWNFVNFNRDVTQTECYDLACQTLFTRRYSFLVKYREEGLALMLGVLRVNNRMIYDFYYGITLRFIDYKKPTLPPRAFAIDQFWFDIPNETPRTTFGIKLGLKFGYRVNR